MPTINNVPGATVILSELAIRNNPDAVVLDTTRVRGGSRYVDTLAARDAIPVDARVLRIMRCFVAETNTIYELRGGITNADWAVVTEGQAGPQTPVNVLVQGGNAFGDPLVLRTLDGQPVRLGVNDKVNLELSASLTKVTGNFQVEGGSFYGTQTQMTLLGPTGTVTIELEGMAVLNLDNEFTSFDFNASRSGTGFTFSVYEASTLHQSKFTPQGTLLSPMGIAIGRTTVGGDSLFSVGSTGNYYTIDSAYGSRPFPLLTTAYRDKIVSPAQGLFVYNTTTDRPEYRDATGWTSLKNAAGVGLADNNRWTGDNVFFSAANTTITLSTAGTSSFPSLNYAYQNLSPSAKIELSVASGEFKHYTAQDYWQTFYSNNLERMRIPVSGNVLIGATVDSGEKLQVTGSSKFSQKMTTKVINIGGSDGSSSGWPELQINGNAVIGNTGTSTYVIGSELVNIGTGGFNNVGLCIKGVSAKLGTSSNTHTPSSAFEIVSTTQGFLLPRMTANQRDAIVSAAEGLMLYVTDGTKGWYGYNGTAWVILN